MALLLMQFWNTVFRSANTHIARFSLRYRLHNHNSRWSRCRLKIYQRVNWTRKHLEIFWLFARGLYWNRCELKNTFRNSKYLFESEKNVKNKPSYLNHFFLVCNKGFWRRLVLSTTLAAESSSICSDCQSLLCPPFRSLCYLWKCGSLTW